MYDKTIIRSGFCDIFNNQSLGRCYQPCPLARLIALTLTLIIPDITKTSSNNCLKLSPKGKYFDLFSQLITLRTESPSIFLEGRNLCRHPRKFILCMLQIQIFLWRQSNCYHRIHCVCQQMLNVSWNILVHFLSSISVFSLDWEAQ